MAAARRAGGDPRATPAPTRKARAAAAGDGRAGRRTRPAIAPCGSERRRLGRARTGRVRRAQLAAGLLGGAAGRGGAGPARPASAAARAAVARTLRARSIAAVISAERPALRLQASGISRSVRIFAQSAARPAILESATGKPANVPLRPPDARCYATMRNGSVRRLEPTRHGHPARRRAAAPAGGGPAGLQRRRLRRRARAGDPARARQRAAVAAADPRRAAVHGPHARPRRARRSTASCCWRSPRSTPACTCEDFGSALVVTLGADRADVDLERRSSRSTRGDLWYRTVVRRQLKRTKLAVESEVPGLLFLEIDGLAHEIAAARAARRQRARARPLDPRRQPRAAALGDRLVVPDRRLPGGDPARQTTRDMPAFRWWEKEHGRAIVTNHPKDAAELERRALGRPRPAARRRRQPREHPLRRRAALAADDEHGARPQTPGRPRAGLLRLLRQPLRRRADVHALPRRDRLRALVGDPAGAARRAAARSTAAAATR